jgi:peptidoglycan/LPS O-acetylase OafA/YrhL
MNQTPTRPEEAVPAAGAPEPGRLAHQPALDGLRGVAVVAVLVFHDALDRDPRGWASGGFLGVDAFFVLSGFLITSLLLVEHGRSNRIALGRFWSRRARRLLPALFITLIGAAAYDFIVAPTSNLGTLRQEAFAVIAYIQNWDAISTNALVTSPLSHTWSLSIEEQFYLVWPLLFAFLLWRTRRNLSQILVVVIAMVATSAGLMAWLYSAQSRDRAFYGTDARAQSLMVGVALALVLVRWDALARIGSRVTIDIVGIVGLAILVLMFVRASPDDALLFRGGFLLVALATACVIAASVQRASTVRSVLSTRILTAIGLISYGLYLYHWPVYLFLSPERVSLHGYPLFLVRCAVTGAIAIVSYFVVERPIRRGALKGLQIRIATPLAVIGVAVLVLVATAGETSSTSSSKTLFAYRQIAQAAPKDSVKVLIAGDAEADDLARAGPGPFNAKGIFGATISTAPCGIVSGNALIGNDASRSAPCPPFGDVVHSAVEGFAPDVTVLMIGRNEVFDRVVDGKTYRVSTYDYSVYLLDQLEQARRVLTAGGAPMLLATTPCTDPPSTAPLHQIVGDQRRITWLNLMLHRFADKHRDTVTVLDVNHLLCPSGVPRPIVHSSVFTADGVSLTPTVARAVWGWLAPVARSVAPGSP